MKSFENLRIVFISKTTSKLKLQIYHEVNFIFKVKLVMEVMKIVKKTLNHKNSCHNS